MNAIIVVVIFKEPHKPVDVAGSFSGVLPSLRRFLFKPFGLGRRAPRTSMESDRFIT